MGIKPQAKIVACILSGLLYIAAGVNHFIHDNFYIDIMPQFIRQGPAFNIAAGIAEIILGAGLLFNMTRYASAIGIILMLLLFLTVHIDMLRYNCRPQGYCVSATVLWLRLLAGQPLLIYWAWSLRNIKN